MSEARARGEFATYVGDGISDFDAALAADYAYAKRGRALERFLGREGVPFTAFSRFEELVGASFAPASGPTVEL